MIRIITIVFLTLCLGCSRKSIEDRWRSEAISSYTDFKLWESARMMNAIEFTGPIIKDSIETFPPDTTEIIYAWYYTHAKDTFWIYSNVDKSGEREPRIHVSENYDELKSNWQAWTKENN